MKAPKPLQPLILVSLIALLTACVSDSPAPAKPTAPAPVQAPAEAAPLPAYQRELSGSLLNVPNEADVELALLAVDQRGRPQALLGNIQLRGTGNPLAFRLPFNPDTFNKHSRIELHGRANQAGRLILRLPAQPIARGETQALGELRLVPAP
ncbi:MAG: YbaY family lipoprotein [Pseudomonas sp.]|uniref:YbaY family lipoprotein n=1 Tax=Pseudomonadota TaxID=1224 RepID=UPI002727A5A5|nr:MULTISPECIES: YbaY family lipoprotein [Pseudomonadota]MDO9618486.1 YbaY family lipoprotein [Pseudomonas sp.]MDP2441604.1 YbaY family lipoprotein [Rhodoferax sp.]MDZ4338054.1 YbaY family lipoprotein [Pseudomonas sp.]